EVRPPPSSDRGCARLIYTVESSRALPEAAAQHAHEPSHDLHVRGHEIVDLRVAELKEMRVHEGLDRRGARFRIENGELAEDVVLADLGDRAPATEHAHAARGDDVHRAAQVPLADDELAGRHLFLLD